MTKIIISNPREVNSLNSLSILKDHYIRTDLTVEKKTVWSWLKRVFFCPKLYNIQKAFQKIAFHNVFYSNKIILDEKFDLLFKSINSKKLIDKGTYKDYKDPAEHISRGAEIYKNAKMAANLAPTAKFKEQVQTIFKIALAAEADEIENDEVERYSGFLADKFVNEKNGLVLKLKDIPREKRASYIFDIANDFNNLINQAGLASTGRLPSSIIALGETRGYLQLWIQDSNLYQDLGIKKLVDDHLVTWVTRKDLFPYHQFTNQQTA